jgi:uncharacterized protein
MTPQERDLLTSLIDRLKAQARQPKDPEAETLIRRATSEQPDAPYLLAQTVLIQDMALNAAQNRIADLERQLAAVPSSSPAPAASFLPSAARASVPAAGRGTDPRQQQTAPAPAASPVWSQSGVTGTAAGFAVAPAQPAGGVTGSGFLQQAATTAAGIAGGALLFQGIESLLGPHYGGGLLSGVPAQPGISETVINNYDGDTSDRGSRRADADQGEGRDSDSFAADQDLSDNDLADDTAGNDSSDGNYDV